MKTEPTVITYDSRFKNVYRDLNIAWNRDCFSLKYSSRACHQFVSQARFQNCESRPTSRLQTLQH